MAAVTFDGDFGAPQIKFATVSTVSPSIFYEVMGPDATECWALGQIFHSPLSLSSRGFLVPLHQESLHFQICGKWNVCGLNANIVVQIQQLWLLLQWMAKQKYTYTFFNAMNAFHSKKLLNSSSLRCLFTLKQTSCLIFTNLNSTWILNMRFA